MNPNRVINVNSFYPVPFQENPPIPSKDLSFPLLSNLGSQAIKEIVDRRPHPAIRVFDWMATGEAKKFLAKDLETPSVTYVGKIADYVFNFFFQTTSSVTKKNTEKSRQLLFENEGKDCNSPSADEVACFPMTVGRNCTDKSPFTYSIHLRAALDPYSKQQMKNCFEEHLKSCKDKCLYCWDPIYSEDFVVVSGFEIEASHLYDSYEFTNREWKIQPTSKPPQPITLHQWFVIQGNAEVLISTCEKSSKSENEKLWYGLGIGSILLSCGGWVIYCKYKDYQYKHLLDGMNNRAKFDKDLELIEVDTSGTIKISGGVH